MNITRYHIGKDLGETIQPQGDVIEHPSGWWCSAGEVEKEINRLTAELAEKEGEIEKVTHDRDLWENIAAMRLADQEAIERHTRRVVAREILAMVNEPSMGFSALARVIRQKYGVE